jgi:NAD(P)-dependent dehydrogenase (short-subunit alcohol dehydrogenase family)
MKAFRLDGKRALISGGSKGIGAAIAKTFAEAGADIGIIGRDRKGLNNTKSLVEQHGRKCIVIEKDISSVEGVKSAGEKALELSPNWDILVNNAGIAKITPLLEITQDEWNETFSINLRAMLLLSQAIAPQMIKRKSGKIVNISSIGAFVGTPGLGTYAASKAAMNQLTRTMAVEWGPYNIQVNAICPTIVLTEMGQKVWDNPALAQQRQDKEKRIPLHRFGQPEEVANVALFLASPAANYIHGVSLPLDGGMTISP